MRRSSFSVPKMNCPSEEKAIKFAFDGIGPVKKLTFDLSKRKLEILHENSKEEVLSVLLPLGFGASLIESHEISEMEEVVFGATENDRQELQALRIVFAINALMFVVELGFGIYAQSTGLISDSLDMFADAAVFAMSLYAVGKSITLKKKAAKVSGYLQMILALGALSEVIRQAITGSEPRALIMMAIAGIALVANAVCMWVLHRHRNGEAHMQASWIFLSNDVIVNAGVILAGVLVKLSSSALPDLIIGFIVASIVFWGSLRILKVSKS